MGARRAFQDVRGGLLSFLLALAIPALLGSAARAQTLRVNDPLRPVLGAGGDVREFQVSPDGTRIVYVADQDLDNIYELYSSAADGSGFIKLNPPFSATFRPVILDFRISPDSQWVVVRIQINSWTFLLSHRIQSSQFFLLSFPNTGNTPTVDDYEIAPDSSSVVFVGIDAASAWELFRTPIDGSTAPVNLSGPLAPGATGVKVVPFSGPDVRITPDGTRVVYVADNAVPGRDDLWSVPLDGSLPPIVLSGIPVAGGGVEIGFDIAPDSTRVVYLADASVNEQFELWSVPVDGSAAPVRVSGALVNWGDVEPGFRITPNGLHVVYRADQDRDNLIELYATEIDRRIARKLNGAVVSGGDVSEFQISSDSAYVVYRADEEVDGVPELFSARILDLAQAKVSGPLVLGAVVEPDFALTADSTSVLYRADQDTLGVPELYGTAIDGSAVAARLSGPLVPGGTVEAFVIDQASQHVVYRADADVAGIAELYQVALGSLQVTKLGVPIAPLTDVQDFALAEATGLVVYVADPTDYYAFEAFAAPLAGGTTPVKLSGPLVPGPVLGNVLDYRVAPGGRWVVYLADAEGEGIDALYSVRLDRPFAALRISGPLVLGEKVADTFLVSPDGRYVVFQHGPTNRRDLFSVPIDGSLPPIRLLAATGPTSLAPVLLVSADSRWVVLDDVDLYSVPIDGSLPAVSLTPQVPFGYVRYVAIDPSSERVVFAGDFDTQGVVELYSAPIDGGAGGGPGTFKLNHSLAGPSGPGDVVDFRVAPAGDRVVYRVQEGASFSLHVYGVPLDGSSAPVRLDGPLVAGGNVQFLGNGFPGLLTPDGASLIYVADQEEDNRFEIFLVPIDGSASSVKLNAPLVANGYVGLPYAVPSPLPIAITPDGARVIYAADQDEADVFELYSVALAAPGAAVKLSGAMVTYGDVQSMEVAPDGLSVVYWADQLTNDVFELFAAPSDGSAPAVRLNFPLASGREVVDFAFTPSSREVLYTANHAQISRYELFRVPLDRSLKPVVVSAVGPVGTVVDVPAPSSFTGPGGELFLYGRDVGAGIDLHLGFLGKPLRAVAAPPSVK